MRRPQPGDWVLPDKAPFEAIPIFGCQPFGANTTKCNDVHPGRTDPETGIRDGRMPSGTHCVCMVCNQSGREGHPGLRQTAGDVLRIREWVPPGGGDQWSSLDTAEPTKYQAPAIPDKPKTRKEKRAERFGHVLPMSPDEIARRIESGRATVCA